MLPFLMALRAVIRAHVTAAQAGEGPGDVAAEKTAEARAYLALGESLLTEKPVLLMAVGGFSGSGKSSVAAAVAPWFGAAQVLASCRATASASACTGSTPSSGCRCRLRSHRVPSRLRSPKN